MLHNKSSKKSVTEKNYLFSQMCQGSGLWVQLNGFANLAVAYSQIWDLEMRVGWSPFGSAPSLSPIFLPRSLGYSGHLLPMITLKVQERKCNCISTFETSASSSANIPLAKISHMAMSSSMERKSIFPPWTWDIGSKYFCTITQVTIYLFQKEHSGFSPEIKYSPSLGWHSKRLREML